jgi:tripartite-type tricarboxylate transporter receptor subunit TctC
LSEGRVKLIAVAAPKRLRDFPSVQTFAEAGFPEVNLAGWGALFLPAGTPSAIVDKWNAEVRRICALPDVQKRIFDMGFEPVANTPAEFSRVISSDLERWTAVVKSSGIKLD